MSNRLRSRFRGSGFRVLWTPSVITSSAWFDAADTSTLTSSSGAVSKWNDKSGNSRHVVQADAADQPTTASITLNGLNTIDFDGSREFISTSPSSVARNVGELTIFSVMKADVDNIDMTPIHDGTDGGPLTRFRIRYDYNSGSDNDYNIGWRRLDDDSFTSMDRGISNTSATVLASIFDFGNNYFNLSVDGALQTADSGIGSGATSDTDTGIFTLGSQRGSGSFFNGQIAEVIIVENVDTTQRQLIEGYLAWKWGLESKLPSDHHYKSGPPTL